MLVISLLWQIIGFGESSSRRSERLGRVWTISGAMILVHFKLGRLTRSVKDLCILLELFEKRGRVNFGAGSLDMASAAGRLVITIIAAVSQWVREAIAERTRDALRHKRTSIERLQHPVRILCLPGRQAR